MQESQREIVVVGASAAGLRCASRLARLRPTWPIIVVEASEVFSYAACGLPYALSGDVAEPELLRRTADGSLRDADYFASVKGVRVLPRSRAVWIDVVGRTLELESSDGSRSLQWDELVLATGAQARRLPSQPQHPRVRTFHTWEDLAPMHEGLSNGSIRRVAIVGAGYAGCELAEAFAALWGAEVILCEASDTPLGLVLDQEVGSIVAQTLRSNDVDVRTAVKVEKIEADDERATLHLGDDQVEVDAVVVAVGVEPNVSLARDAGVRLGASGAITVDERFQTSLPHIWAVGDCIEVSHAVTGAPCHLPLGSLANRQGRTLASILAGHDQKMPPVCGSLAVKVFDTNVAATGLSRRRALALGVQARSVWICAQDRAHYWPEARELALQLTYEDGSGRLLGLQAAGEGDVTKRVDVAAQLIARNATVEEIAQIEHAYAPPYAPALDPLAVAAMVAQNQRHGVEAVSPTSMLEEAQLLDVRHSEEQQARPLRTAPASSIPQEEIRKRLAEIEGGSWVAICERGTRSAEVARWLSSRGRPARFLGGGLRWRALAGIDSGDGG